MIARRFERTLRFSAAEVCHKPWLWSGPWALFRVGENVVRFEEDEEDYFDDDGEADLGQRIAVVELAPVLEIVEDTFAEINAELGDLNVVELIFCGATLVGENETAASDGPDWPGTKLNDDTLGRKRDISCPAAAADADFEKARSKHRRQVEREAGE